ncbi:MAG TPA: septum formation initiator family protein [Candidatus Atribacteria bacterium]|nr:septum formation initiator family protein [Candidatus Atribacteria bacterium]
MPKQKRKYVLKMRAKIMLVLLLLGYFLFVMAEQEIALSRQRADIDSLVQRIEQAQYDNEVLKRQIEYTKTPEYIEKIARSRLGWVKDNEIIFIEKKD